MKPNVFIANPVPADIEAYIGQHCQYRKWDRSEPIPRGKLLEEVRDAEGLLLHGLKVDEELLAHAPHLRVISTISVGYNNFDIGAMRKRKVLGTHTPYVLDDTVADLVFALILSSARRIAELDRYVKEGKWKKGDNENLFGIDVHHRTLGIIGMGRIGEKVAKRAKLGFDMEVLYYNRRQKPEIEEHLGVTYVSLETLLRQSDFIVLLTPLTPQTVQLIGDDQFQLMKEEAIFINASRGQTVDEQALVRALQSGRIRGAGLDVFQQEPIPPDHPLLALPNVVTVPHIGSATHQTRRDMARVAAENLVKALQGDSSCYVVPELKDLILS